MDATTPGWVRLNSSSVFSEEAMTVEEQLDDLWVVQPGLHTLTFDGARIEIRIDDAGVHYVVDGIVRDHRHLGDHDSPWEYVAGFKRRVAGQLSNGIWPPI
jgi:hypothetical protein